MPRRRRVRNVLLLLGAIFLSLSVHQAFADDPFDEPWNLRTSLPQGNTLNSIIYANGLYVAVGANGTVETSTDQVTWKSQTLVSSSGQTEPGLTAVTYGNGLFVAVGTYIWTSPDGLTWTYRSCPTGPFLAVAYGNGIFVAAGGTGGLFNKTGAPVMATSPDGITWTDRSVSSGMTSEPTKAVIFADGKFIQLAWHQPPYYSTDGLAWTAAKSASSSYTLYNHAAGLAYGNGVFVIVGPDLDFVQNYGGTILLSNDGMTWTRLAVNIDFSTPSSSFAAPTGVPNVSLGTDLCFGNGIFMALEADCDSSGVCGQSTFNTYTSADGQTWTAHPITNAWGNAFAASPAGFTLVGSGGAIYTTADNGVTWKSVSTPTILATNVVWGNGMYVVVGSEGSIYTSPDGTSWTARSTSALASESFKSVVYGNKFVAVGTDSNSGAPTVVTSADGVTWTAQTEPSAAPTTALAYANGTYIGVGGSTIYSSTDGVAWTARAKDPSGASLNGSTFGNGTFMVVGDSTIMTSPDGTTWASQSSGVSYKLVGVAAGNNLFAAAGDNGAIRVSADGKSWSEAASNISGALNAIAFGADRFAAIGGQGYVSYSSDGKTWTARTLGPYGNTGYPWAIAYGNETTASDGSTSGTFVAVSANTILQSNAVVVPASSTQTPTQTSASPSADPASAAGSGGGGGGCFIATAAYGGDFAWQVRTFKEFRDRHLLTNQAGRMFVRWYYRVSPPMAAFIADRPTLRAAIRMVLTPAAYALRRPSKSAALCTLGLFLFILIRRRA